MGNGQVIKKNSPISGDVFPAMPGTGVFNFMIPAFGGAYLVKNLPPDPPAYAPNNKFRDTLLSITPSVEGMWANAVGKATRKITSRDYEFTGPDAQIERMYDLFDECENGKGLHYMAAMMARDFFTTDNGAWVCIQRASDNPNAEITGFFHLDSLRCWRTGDPNIPIYYYDLLGQYHALNWYECFNIVDMPSARAGFYNSGTCAAARAFRSIRKLTAIDIYFDEKITGEGYTSIEFIQGITPKQLEDAMAVSDENAKSTGVVYYKGKLVIPILRDTPVTNASIQLKGLPDGFEREKETDEAHLVYANALGMPPLEINPRLTARGALGIGASSQIIDDNSEGYGQAWFDQQFTRAVNRLIVPSRTTFAWSVNDLRDQEKQATVKKARADTRSVRILSGEISVVQAQQIAHDEGDLPAELMQVADPTIDNKITNDEKPDQQLIKPEPSSPPEVPEMSPRDQKRLESDTPQPVGALPVPKSDVPVTVPIKKKEAIDYDAIRAQLLSIKEALTA